MYEVSLIIPIYNVEKYIKVSLLSALNQSFQSIEYILVDDCSTDKSMDVAKVIIQASPRRKDVFIYKQDKNSGLSSTRNLGMTYASGRYIFFMDSDDEISENCIQKHYETIISKSADFTVANVKLIGSKSVHIHPIDKRIEDMVPLESYFQRQWSVSAWNKLYRREFLEDHQIQFVNGIHHEDYLWSFKVAKQAKRLAFVKEQTYLYKIRQGSITTIINGDLKIRSMLFVISTIGEEDVELKKERDKFLGFLCFNTALYILKYEGEKKRSIYYNILKITPPKKNVNIYRILTKLPYFIFCLTIKPIYLLYKFLITK